MSQVNLPAGGGMSPAVAGQLVALNQTFYARLAEPFARSRQAPQPGFARLRTYLLRPGPALLDVGCGEGRLGRYLWAQQAISAYAGVDFSEALLDQARASVAGQFWQRDLTRPGCLDDLGQFGAIACLSTLQHVPGRGNRQRLVAEMAAHLVPGGLLLLANWQFLDSPRQRRKLADWAAIGLAPDDVEAGDYLLTWQRGGFGLRYVCLLDLAATEGLVVPAGLQLVDHYRSDGREGDLNLYSIWRAANG